MSNVIKYGVVCEDKPQRIFIEKILPAIISKLNSDKSFQEDSEFKWRYGKPHNKKAVLNTFVEACAEAVGTYKLNVCFVGVDLDAISKENFDSELNNMQNQLSDSLKKSSLIFIPVQCIEHWLWHLLWKIEHPNSTQNLALENETRQAAKKKIYGRVKPADEEKINVLLANVDLDWLCSRSFSFNHFFKSVESFLTNY
ncbi:MAG: hypothetical protein RIQ33_293 [Bacteroidota bacterium]|jgi:hypothetical protein